MFFISRFEEVIFGEEFRGSMVGTFYINSIFVFNTNNNELILQNRYKIDICQNTSYKVQ
jgi:hypothetical protein